MIFGGEAFVDLIGEISLMKDLTHAMDITQEQMEEEELAARTEAKLNVQDDKEGKASAAPMATGPKAYEGPTAQTAPSP
jgi:hypothetical protein